MHFLHFFQLTKALLYIRGLEIQWILKKIHKYSHEHAYTYMYTMVVSDIGMLAVDPWFLWFAGWGLLGLILVLSTVAHRIGIWGVWRSG